MNDLLTKRNVIIWVITCFVLASVYASLVIPISDRVAASASEAKRRADAQTQVHAHAVAWRVHLKRVEWQREHPAEYARQKAEARAAERQREVAAQNAQRAANAKEQAQNSARAAAEARQQAEAANLFHGSPDCLVLDKRTLTSESGDYTWYIEGKVVNNCDRDFGYAQVEFSFYDSAGNQVSSGLTNINNLVAGQTWSFKKPVYETQAAGSWRVVKLSGF
jgi:hypothetical protein